MTNYSIEVRMSENEKLDDQLRNGTDYVNLPQHLFPMDRAPTWILQQETSVDSESKSPKELCYRPSTTIGQIRSHHYANQQQIDAQNRLQQLEIIRPKENLDLLNVKFRHVQHPRHSRPILPQYRDDYVNTLYDQTGSFVNERAGLYHTENYEPSALVQAIPELANQSEDSSLTTEKTSSKLFQTRALGDYQNMRNQLLKKLSAPNDGGAVNARTQEGNTQFVQTQSTYGQSFNTPKFLQENRLAFHARTDPTRLMSTRFNGNLNRARSMNSYPLESTENLFQITKSNQPLVSPILRPSNTDEIYSTNYIGEHTNGYIRRPTVRVYDSPFRNSINSNRTQSFKQQSNDFQTKSFDANLSIPKQIPRSVKTVISLPGQEIVAKLIEPTFAPRTTYQNAFKDVIYQELPFQAQKSTTRAQQSSTDTHPRRSQLKDIQERWSKTQALRDYHLEYPEPIPDVGGNTIRAKKEILLADEFAKRAALIIR